jgi:alpha-ribazole phosphatase/probable phosphoglycerate mutase
MDRMNEILLIRHAETDMAGTFCGHSDPELNTRGYVQLAKLIDKLRSEDIGAVYSSDLRRCLATASAVAETFCIDFHVRRTLREISFGQWEGLTWEQIERQNEAYAQRWITDYPRLPAPGGENTSDFERRVLRELKLIFIETENSGRRIAVITHAGVLRTVLCKLLGCSDEEAWNRTRSYCSIVRYPVTHSSSLGQERWNDLLRPAG